MDPYHHAYHNEVGPFIQALNAFQLRIASFDYPDNATLQRLVQISQKIQQLPLSSPLMRWLIGLETLLGKIQEWEQSAASFVSLKVEMAQLSRFVIRWRKFELESWSMVLDRRSKEARKKTMSLWFHLHESLLQAQSDAYWSRLPPTWLKPESAEKASTTAVAAAAPHLEVFKLLDEFCRLSTLGDFQLRCELLQAFANYCQVNVVDNSISSSAVPTLSSTLRNLALYYAQFMPNCAKTLTTLRAPIQTKLENQVKISSWDDRNYFALKESADKSHRIILKLAKEFDLVLESPVHQVFEQTAVEYVAEDPKVLSAFSMSKRVAISLELPKDHSGLGRTTSAIYKRARELAETRIASDAHLCENHDIPRDLFDMIKDRLQTLDKDSPVQWKKRALIDLFTEFKSQLRSAPPVPHRLRDFREVFACELALPSGADGGSSLFAGLFHLNRLRNLVRSPVTDRSEDLSMEECNRGVSIGEVCMMMILQEREVLVKLAKHEQAFARELAVWEKLASSAAMGDSLLVYDVAVNRESAELNLELALKGCRDLEFLAQKLAPSHAGNSMASVRGLSELQEEIARFKRERCCTTAQAEDFNKRFQAESRLALREVTQLAKQIPSCDRLVERLVGMQELRFTFNPVQLLAPTANGGDASDASQQQQQDVKFVQTCQLFVQAFFVKVGASKQGADEEAGLKSQHDWLLACHSAMRFGNFVAEMRNVTREVLTGKLAFADAERIHGIASLAKLASALFATYHQAFLSFHHALCRLEEFILKLFRSVVEKGFCRPPEEEENAGEEGVDENLKEGTGMGEGQGRDNVSKEIEDEEQLLGLKGDKQDEGQDAPKPKPEKDQEEEEDGVEMENDFDGGEMHDMDREDAENEDEEEEEKEEEKEELDRDMGDTGEDSQTVDEKLWDEKEDEKTEDEKFEDNAPMKGKEQELRSKDQDDEQAEQKEQKEDKAGKKKEEEEEAAAEGDEEEDGEDFKADEMEENNGLEKDEEDEGAEEEEDDDGGPAAPEMEGKVDEAEPEDFEMPDGEEAPLGEEDNEGKDEDDGEDLNELAEEEDEEDKNQTDSPEEPEPEESDGRLTLPTQANEDNEERREEKEEVDNDAFVGQGTTSHENNKNSAQQNDQQQQAPPPPEQEEKDPGSSNQTGGTSGGANGDRFRKGADEQNEDKLDAEQEKRKDLNPWRDPGDASKEWSRRKKIVETMGAADAEENEGEEDDDKQTVEFKRKEEGDDDQDKFDQALAPQVDETAEERENVKMDDEEEEEKEEEQQRKKKQEEKDAAKQELNPAEDKEEKHQKQQQQQRSKRGKFYEDLEESSSEEEEEEEEVKPKEEVAVPPPPQTANAAEPFLLFTKRDAGAEEQVPSKISMEEVEIANHAGEEQDTALLSDEALERGRLLWQRAVNETFESSQHLCEQLRLVLEPTTATKLKGDYRTGTRINMRRVIAYIASGYKKDKIWQKRSKPSRRKYHIALAIDDSKSMKPCQDLAIAALALITRALTQLEVGEVGIWSFGTEVKKLHDLSKPFSETSGALVSSHFGFDQNSTCIEEGLSTVIDTLTSVASNDGKLSEQPRQLVFVISDGRFDTGSRPRIAKLLRTAKERKQLVALIVVEPAEEAESILDVRQVSFRKDGSGAMDMTRYLEDYPFPYYIVLRDMKALPEVLADGLKQWFELIVGDAM